MVDEVVVRLSDEGASYEALLGPTHVITPTIDLSRVDASDQRYALPNDPKGLRIRIDSAEHYTMSAAGYLWFTDNTRGVFGYRSYDADGLEIEPIHVARHGYARDTRLVAPLSPGDAWMLLEDASGWSTEPTESAESRSLAWYGYTNSRGETYADYTYTRHVATDLEDGLWAPGAIWFDASVGAYRVPLNQPWDGPALAAGTAVRNAAAGVTLSEPFPSSLINLPKPWTPLEVTIGGEWQDGQRDELAFRPGTEFVEIELQVDASFWNSFIFGPEGDFSAPSSPTSLSGSQATGFTLDLDLHAKFSPASGDYNRDGRIDAADYTAWRDALGATGLAPYQGADGDGNGRVGEADRQVWASHFGTSGPASPVATPPGDYNRDGQVDAADYTAWRDTVGATGLVPYRGADGDGDGSVGETDGSVWRNHYGERSAPTSQNLVLEAVTAEQGSATIIATPEGPVVRYQSASWFVGTDVVHYTLRDTAGGGRFTSRVLVSSIGANYGQDALLAASINAQATTPEGNTAPEYGPRYGSVPIYETIEGSSLVVNGVRHHKLLSPFRDVDDDQLVVRLLTGPSDGVLDLSSDGGFTYTPRDGFVGQDSFRYEVFDGVDSSYAAAVIRVDGSADELAENRLKSVTLGMLNHEASLGRFPVEDNVSYFDENGQPYVSWRVHLLRYFNSSTRELYDRFRLDEPWDSPHNLPLLAEMPDLYRHPDDPGDSTTTRLQTFTGPEAPFGRQPAGVDQSGPRVRDFEDGASRTILLAESGAGAAVLWTKPDDLVFDPSDPLAALGDLSGGKIRIGLADGAVHTLSTSIDPDDFAGLVTLNGDELVDINTVVRGNSESGGQLTEEELATARAEQNQSMRQLALSFLNYHDVRSYFPVDTLLSPSGDTEQNVRGLSWRVLILPFIGQQDLYDRFRLDEPWDSPHNLALLDEMPDAFRSVGDPADSSTTRIVRPHGEEALFYNRPGSGRGNTIRSIADGLSQTLMAYEAGPDRAVPWTKPDSDPDFDPATPLALLGDQPHDDFPVIWADGSTGLLTSDIEAETLSALVTRNGREIVDRFAIEARQRRENEEFKSAFKRQDELKQLIIAMLSHLDLTSRLPANRYSPDGVPLLSWHVELLRFMGYESLYSQFHRDEPWDSPHNLALVPLMPDVFRSVGDPPDSTTTRIAGFTGRDETVFPASTDIDRRGIFRSELIDRQWETIAFVEAGPEAAVPWTKPVDRPMGDNPFSALGDLGEAFHAMFMDGHLEILSSRITPSELRAMLTRNGGEDIDSPPQISIPPGVFVLESGGDSVTHESGVDVVHVVLDTAPTSQVVVDLVVSDTAIATLDQARLVFTPSNWSKPQSVAIRAVDNATVSDDRPVDISITVATPLSAPEYGAVGPTSFTAWIVDDEPRAPALLGDFNLDGVINAADYTVWRDSLGETNLEPYSGADADGNGQVANADFDAWRSGYGASPANALQQAAFTAMSFDAPSQTASHSSMASSLDDPARAQDEALLLLVGHQTSGTSTAETQVEGVPIAEDQQPTKETLTPLDDSHAGV